MHALKWMLVLVILAAIGVGGTRLHDYAMDARRFPIQEVKIIGDQKAISQSQLRQMLKPYLKQGFFGIKVGNLQTELHELGWVQDLSIRRKWPHTLVIHLREYKLRARLQDDYGITEEGLLIEPKVDNYPQGIVQILGPKEAYKEMYDNLNTMEAMLAPLELKLKLIVMAPRGAWTIKLDNGLEVFLGKKQVLQRLARFVAVYPKIIATQTRPISYIDLRYTSGLAVGWKNA